MQAVYFNFKRDTMTGKRNFWRFLSGVLILCGFSAAGCGGDSGDGGTISRTPMVYVMSNLEAGNTVVAFRRGSDGTLTRQGVYATGGVGTGRRIISPLPLPDNGIDPLTAQGSLARTADGNFLVAANTGSGTISCFRVGTDGSLTLTDTKPAGGNQPNCADISGRLLYVGFIGNAADQYHSGVTGFQIGSDGKLNAVANSTRSLSAVNAEPTRVIFSPDGALLAVNEVSTNKISVYPVQADGTLATPKVNAAGTAPFGSYFLPNGRLMVAEAPLPAGTGAASAYALAADGTLTAATQSLANGQSASCWVIPTPDGRFAYTSNACSGTISLYRVNADGSISLAQAMASALDGAASGPVDGAVSPDGQFLYALESGKGALVVLRVAADGSLTTVQTLPDANLPSLGTDGLVLL